MKIIKKVDSEKIKIFNLIKFIFSLSTFLIIFIEILINLSVKNYLLQSTLYTFPFIGMSLTFYILKNFLIKEPISK